MRNGITNHYGIYVDRNVPITGVINNCSAIYDALQDSDSVDLAWEDHKLECADYIADGFCNCESDSSGEVLIGGWKIDPDSGLYEIDRTSPHGYAAIVGEVYTQIVWSLYTTRAALCSPCYAGQCDLDSVGSYLGYTLPPEMQESESGERLALVITHETGFGI